MKQFFTFLLSALLLANTAAPAQTTDPVRQKLDAIFAPLDKSQVPTGRLLEYAELLVPLLYHSRQQPNSISCTNLTNPE